MGKAILVLWGVVIALAFANRNNVPDGVVLVMMFGVVPMFWVTLIWGIYRVWIALTKSSARAVREVWEE